MVAPVPPVALVPSVPFVLPSVPLGVVGLVAGIVEGCVVAGLVGLGAVVVVGAVVCVGVPVLGRHPAKRLSAKTAEILRMIIFLMCDFLLCLILHG